MRLLTAEEFGERIGLSAPSVRQMSKDGRLPAPITIGKLLRWREAEVNRFIEGETEDMSHATVTTQIEHLVP